MTIARTSVGDLVSPAYGRRALPDLVPSLLASLGMPGGPAPIAFAPSTAVVLLLVDGLGHELLMRHAEEAPFLVGLASPDGPLTSAFPSSTAVSVTSVGTGRTPGEHGLVGYTMWLPELDEVLECLTWTRYGRRIDASDECPPETVQPHPSLFEAAVAAGISGGVVSIADHDGSALTRAAFRRPRFVGLESFDDTPERLAGIRTILAGAERAFVYTYYPGLDAAGHVSGVASEAWRAQLRRVDALVRKLAVGLPPGTDLVVTGDHGMVDVPPGTSAQVDLADVPVLDVGLRTLAGEPRMRHAHAQPGEASALVGRWRAALGDRWTVLAREEAIHAGLFGPVVADTVRERIGDALAIATGTVGLFDRRRWPWERRLVGQHGALTDDERLVPLLQLRT